MKYSERDELVAGLRDLADFIEDRGVELPVTYPHIRLTEWLYGDVKVQREKLRRAARALGKADKVHSGESLRVKRSFSENVTLEIVGNREAVCVKRVVGTREVPAYSAPARTEEIVEWDCIDPLLKG